MEPNITENTPSVPFPRFLLNLIIHPARAFTQLDQTGRPRWIWPAIAVLAVVWLAAIAALPVTQREAGAAIDTLIQQSGDKYTETQLAAMEQQRSFSTNPVFLVASEGILQTIAYPILWASAAGVLYLLSLVFGGRAKFGSLLSVAVWATLAETLGKIALTVGTLAAGHSVQPGLSYLVDTKDLAALAPGPAALASILSRITVFDIWYLVLIGIGVFVCAHVTRAKSALITVLYGALSLVPPAAMAAVGAAISSSFLGG
jgi:hypothetical protein